MRNVMRKFKDYKKFLLLRDLWSFPRATEAYKLVKVGSHNVDTKNVRDIEMKHPIYGINFGSLFDGAKREQK